MTDENDTMETVIDETEVKETENTDVDEGDSIQKPPKRKGRPPLTEKQKANLAKGREISRRNQIKRMAKEKLEKIENEEKKESINIKTEDEEPKEEIKPKVNKKKPKKKVVIQSDTDSSSDEIVYVSKKKKKKPKRKVIIESSSESDDSSDEDYPPTPQPVHNIPQRRLIFR